MAETSDTNVINSQYFDKDYDEVKIIPANESSDDSDNEMAEKFGY